MDGQNQEYKIRIVNMLEDAARQIRQLEAEAQEALYSKDSLVEYRQKLQQKTSLLMQLPAQTAETLKGMGAGERERIQQRLEGFARRAELAMELESLFYMAALLYPENHRDGEKNDLENYIDQLKQ